MNRESAESTRKQLQQVNFAQKVKDKTVNELLDEILQLFSNYRNYIIINDKARMKIGFKAGTVFVLRPGANEATPTKYHSTEETFKKSMEMLGVQEYYSVEKIENSKILNGNLGYKITINLKD